MAKKRHHYVPKAYLKSFCDDRGTLYVYRKDEPKKELRLSPDNTGFHKYYYSQPLPDGGYDHDKLEDYFNRYEAKWPAIIQNFRDKENVNDHLDTIFAFIGLQRARVPAARDACEKLLAETVKATWRQLDAAGKLPPPPKGLEDILEQVEVSIDPHQSIHAMAPIIKGYGDLMKQIGIGVLHNRTDIPFLTSDNPVIWFDPSLPEGKMQPYAVRLDGPIVLMFPVASHLMIYGHSTKQAEFARHGLCYGELNDAATVKEMNRQVCRFAYETVYASKPGFARLVREYADESPVIRTETIPAPNGQFPSSRFVWGKRTRKPKWEPRNGRPQR
ncbi:MAG TPA: DUF4238 domain-containing protein [Thermoguttaceae bacterium]|nr:DUF4238 domain-containing protein [Thermoguttaceae bacterium]